MEFRRSSNAIVYCFCITLLASSSAPDRTLLMIQGMAGTGLSTASFRAVTETTRAPQA